MVAHLTGGQGVAGSNPVSPTDVMSRDIVDSRTCNCCGPGCRRSRGSRGTVTRAGRRSSWVALSARRGSTVTATLLPERRRCREASRRPRLGSSGTSVSLAHVQVASPSRSTCSSSSAMASSAAARRGGTPSHLSRSAAASRVVRVQVPADKVAQRRLWVPPGRSPAGGREAWRRSRTSSSGALRPSRAMRRAVTPAQDCRRGDARFVVTKTGQASVSRRVCSRRPA